MILWAFSHNRTKPTSADRLPAAMSKADVLLPQFFTTLLSAD